MVDQTANFAWGTILTAPSPASTGLSFVLNSGQGDRFPDPAEANYNVIVKAAGERPLISNSEIVRVTAKSSDTFTIAREQEGTEARSILVGDEVFISWTKKSRDDIQTEIDAADTAAAAALSAAQAAQTDADTANADLATHAADTSTHGVSGAILGTEDVLDEDTMTTNSEVYPPSQQSVKVYVDTQVAAVGSKVAMFENALTNGNFDVWQKGTAFTSASTPANSDDTYLADRWNLISDGNDAVDVSRDTDSPEGSKYSIKLDTETAKRYGIVQFIEAADVTKLKGKTVSLSFAVKSANITALRAAVLSWGSTADTLTSDVVGTWGATPTWAADWTAENTPGDLTVTSSWTTVTIEGIVLDSATINNLAIVIWTPNEETIGDIVYISQVKLNEGATATAFQPRTYQDELLRCKRYFHRWTSVGAAGAYKRVAVGHAESTTDIAALYNLPVEMRISPSVSSSGNFAVYNAASVIAVTSLSKSTAGSGSDVITLQVAVASGLDAGESSQLFANNNNTAYIDFVAEL